MLVFLYRCYFKVVLWKGRVVQRLMWCMRSVSVGMWASTFDSLKYFPLFLSTFLHSYTGISPLSTDCSFCSDLSLRHPVGDGRLSQWQVIKENKCKGEIKLYL